MRRLFFAFLGFAISGFTFYGAMVGYGVGILIDMIIRRSPNSARTQQSYYSRPNPFQSNYHQSPYTQAATGNDFISVLLILSAAVIKADGKVLKSELNFLKIFFKNQFGDKFTVQHLTYLKDLLGQSTLPVNETCARLRYQTTPEVKIQLIHYLFGVAKADERVSDVEIQVIQRIARQLHLTEAEFESIKNIFYRNPQSDYIILGISETATDDEIKKAYRKMAIKYHPDKVQSMGEEHQKAAKEKFQQIQTAYENIKKARGIK